MRPRKPNSGASDDTVRIERSLLQCVMERPALIGEIEFPLGDAFLLADHRRLWQAAVALHNEGLTTLDIGLLAEKSGVDPTVIGEMFCAGAVPTNFPHYVRRVQEAYRERRFQRLHEELGECAPEDRPRVLEQIQQLPQDASDWRSIFHTVEEFEDEPPLSFAINNFLQEAGVTMIGGLSGHGKTLLMLAMARALLEESTLFGYEAFNVPRTAQRILYLIPESAAGPFWYRLKLFRLEDYVRTDRLLVRTLSMRENVPLHDARMLRAAAGADIFLDTAVRFMDGPEDVESTRPFADVLFRLLNAGARSITGAHHAPKSFETQEYMSLEKILRGSGDIGAMLCTAWGVRQLHAGRNTLYVQNVKARDFHPCLPFVLEGRPHLDKTGYFLMTQKPGEAGDLRSYLPNKSGAGGRPETDDKDGKLRQALDLRDQGKAVREIAEKVGVGKSTIDRWFWKHDLSQNRGTEFRDSAGIGTG